MDTMLAFAMGQRNRNKEQMVFDWNKAARLIREHNATEASAGLSGDWEYTGGPIFSGGRPLEEHSGTYLSSTWATPELEIDGMKMDCFVMQNEAPTWHADTFWPASALEILSGKAQ